MTTEALPVPFVRPHRCRGRGIPGLLPILVTFAAWAAWAAVAEPFAVLRDVVSQGWGASDETLFLAVVSVLGLVAVVLFSIAVGAYVLAMRSLRRTR
jgi:hypothetical protein